MTEEKLKLLNDILELADSASKDCFDKLKKFVEEHKLDSNEIDHVNVLGSMLDLTISQFLADHAKCIDNGRHKLIIQAALEARYYTILEYVKKSTAIEAQFDAAKAAQSSPVTITNPTRPPGDC